MKRKLQLLGTLCLALTGVALSQSAAAVGGGLQFQVEEGKVPAFPNHGSHLPRVYPHVGTK
jgi:hypothetical protein